MDTTQEILNKVFENNGLNVNPDTTAEFFNAVYDTENSALRVNVIDASGNSALLWEEGTGTASAKLIAQPTNTVSGENSLAVGKNHTTDGENSAIVGGDNNTIMSLNGNSFIGGGGSNIIYSNLLNKNNNSIIGGYGNSMLSTSNESSIIGGRGNDVGAPRSGIIVGTSNNISSTDSINSTILGGNLNDVVYGENNSIIGGTSNNITNLYNSTILGGKENIIYSDFCSIIGGDTNNIGTGVTNSVIIGGNNQTLTTADTVMVPNLYINDKTSFGTSSYIEFDDATSYSSWRTQSGGTNGIFIGSDDYLVGMEYGANSVYVYSHYNDNTSKFNIYGGVTIQTNAINDGNIDFKTESTGIILTTPDGSAQYKITIDNSGNLVSTLVV